VHCSRWVIILFLLTEVSPVSAQEMFGVEPKEIDDLLANPNMGWQTFQRFADDDPALFYAKRLARFADEDPVADGLPSSVAYFRFYWKDLEPEPGKPDFVKFDGLLAKCRAAGQKLAFRIMVAGSGQANDFAPLWLKEMGVRGFEYTHRVGGPTIWTPDLDDPAALDVHLRTIRMFGERYDGHPDVCLVDIGTVGLWGEWHFSGTKRVDTGDRVPLPRPEVRKQIIDTYLAAFKKTPLVMLIGDTIGMKHASAGGAGWRADCLGDMGGFSPTWNHMKYYPEQLGRCGVLEAWKRAPVAFESCWDVRKWVEEGWDVKAIFDWALKVHVSYMNNKSAPVPEEARDKVENFIRKMGYRFVLRSLEHPAAVGAGSAFPVEMTWENVGVAPCYADYEVALGLADGEGKRVWTHMSGQSIRSWLPGESQLAPKAMLPAELAPGTYALQVAIVDPATVEPAVKLAIAGGRDDGWYPVSTVTVK